MTLFSGKRAYDTTFKFEVNPAEAEDYDKDFRESFLDNWHFQTYTGNSYSRTDNLHDEFAKDIAKIEEQTGKKLKNPYLSSFEAFAEDVKNYTNPLYMAKQSVKKIVNPDYEAQEEQARLDEYYSKVNELKKEYPELEARGIDVIKNDIKAKALELYRKVNDGRDSSWLGDFAGSAAGAMIDPINLAGTLISGGGNAAKTGIIKALGKTAAAEFLTNSGIEAAIQPSVYNYKKELDLPYTKEEAAMNVLAAGVGGAVLGTAAKGLKLGSKEVLARYKKAVAKGVELSPEVKADALLLEKQIEFDDWIDETTPYGQSIEGANLHKQQILDEMKRLTQEKDALSRAYDEVKASPAGEPMEALAEIAPEDMEKVWVNRGGYAGKNDVSGSGFGLVKFIFKHGKDEIPVEKADVVDFPRIVREYEPILTDKYGNNRTWSIKRADGTQIIYADRIFNEDGQRHLVTIHAVTKDQHKLKGIFSETKSRREAKPAHTNGYSSEVLLRSPESSAEASAPKSRFHDGGGSMEDIISTETPKVKDFEALSFDEIEKGIDENINLKADEKALAKDEIAALRREESWDNEILDCIVEFKGR